MIHSSNKFIFGSPKARRRSRLATKWPDSKRPYIENDAPLGANALEIENLRLSAFQNGVCCVKFEPQNDILRSISNRGLESTP